MMFLSALGWINDAPSGNRLRWTYPVSDVADGKFLSFPKAIVLERAPVDDLRPHSETPSSPYAPDAWWRSESVTLTTGVFPQHAELVADVQLLRFTFRGPASRVLVWSRNELDPVFDKVLQDADRVVISSSLIYGITVYAASAQLEDVESVDFYLDRSLNWQTLAKIDISGTLIADFDAVAVRHDVSVQLKPSEWEQLVEQANDALTSSPDDPTNGDLSAWDAFELLLGLRWEHAVLFGFGFVDGPKSTLSEIDQIVSDLLLSGPAETTMAYRVRDAEDRVAPSNIALCLPQVAAALAIPEVPSYRDPTVNLNADNEFIASLEVTSASPSLDVISHIFEENVSASSSVGGVQTMEQFEVSTDTNGAMPVRSETLRLVQVPFHDVSISSRAGACDGWDRTSIPSAWSAPRGLSLEHEPLPPMLSEARFNGDSLELEWKTDEEGHLDWIPDVVLQHAGATLAVYTQTGTQRVVTANASEPQVIDDQLYQVRVNSILDLQDFESGQLVGQGNRFSIQSVSGNRINFTVPTAGAGQALFPAGPVTLRQDPMHLNSWVEIASLDALALSATASIDSAVLSTNIVQSFHARLKYLGRVGPESNVIQALKQVPVPTRPPPFSVDLLGVDFFNRTLIKLTFSSPQPLGLYRIWWADGVQTAATFDDSAVEGEYSEQTLTDSISLFDTLSLPLPLNLEHAATIGVQRVNEMGGQSLIETVSITIPAISSGV